MRPTHLVALKKTITRSVLALLLLSSLLVTLVVISTACLAEAPTAETTDDPPGQIKITGKQAGFDKENKVYLATGEATLTIGGQHSRLTADSIEYQLKSGIVTARGNVKILRNGDSSEGSSFKFDIRSSDYLITGSNTKLIDPSGHLVAEGTDSPDARGIVAVSQSAGENYKWTLERMLMATAMPLTQDERTFLSEHPNLDGISSWKFELFQTYASSELGRNHVSETAVRWRGVVAMLKKQMAAGAKLLKLQPLSVEDADKSLDSSSSEQIQALLIGKGAEHVFEKMKTWRQDVAILAPFVELMREKSRARGLEERFESAIGDE